MLNIAILDAPTDLGLMPIGVDGLGAALQTAGLREGLDAAYAGRVEPLPYDERRDDETGLLNPRGLRDFALQQAAAVGALLDRGAFPLVLGGDDSILFGNLLALRRRGGAGWSSSTRTPTSTCPSSPRRVRRPTATWPSRPAGGRT